jgi:hypothetical protein
MTVRTLHHQRRTNSVQGWRPPLLRGTSRNDFFLDVRNVTHYALQ